MVGGFGGVNHFEPYANVPHHNSLKEITINEESSSSSSQCKLTNIMIKQSPT
jgi:hypothetical protein